MFAPTLREMSTEAEMSSHRLLLRAGFIRQLAAGIYSFLPLGLLVLQHVTNIIRDEMNRAGAQELLLPALHPQELWAESGREATMQDILIKATDRRGTKFYLGPTHEEVITDLVRHNIRSYRDLPLNLYQIQMKYRDEPRPRGGLVRTREFLMKDAYSFHCDEASLDATYQKMIDTYKIIFRRCGLAITPVDASGGAIGGKETKEFMLLIKSGEDTVLVCPQCGYAANREIADNIPPCCGVPYEERSGMELGHVFKLRCAISEPLHATVTDENGAETPIVMGCYGIGVSRILAAVAEVNNDENGLIWPMSIALYHVYLLAANPTDQVQKDLADHIYNEQTAAGIDVLYDDRSERVGVKFKDADLIGVPLRLLVGRLAGQGICELHDRKTGVNVDVSGEQVVSEVSRSIANKLPYT
jgi:prolyl-tRNA synthetase